MNFLKNLLSLYYEVIKGYTCIDELKHNYPREWKTAEDKVLQIEINSTNETLVHKRISKVLKNNKNFILIGGPPCQLFNEWKIKRTRIRKRN